MEVNIEDFKRGCRLVGGEFEEKTRTVVCELNDEEKLVMDNKGRWIKTYGLVSRPVYAEVSVRTWSVPTEIIIDEKDKSMEIVLVSGNSILVTVWKFRPSQIPAYIPNKVSVIKGWDAPIIADDPEEMLPEFKKLWAKQRYAARKRAFRLSEIKLYLGAVRRNLGLPVLKDNIKLLKKQMKIKNK